VQRSLYVREDVLFSQMVIEFSLRQHAGWLLTRPADQRGPAGLCGAGRRRPSAHAMHASDENDAQDAKVWNATGSMAP